MYDDWYLFVCCIFFSLLQDSGKRKLLDDPYTFHCDNYFGFGGIRSCLSVSYDPMLAWIHSNSCPINFLLLQSHQAEIAIVKHLIQGPNNLTKVQVEPRSCDQNRRRNDAFALQGTLSIWVRYYGMKCHHKVPKNLIQCQLNGSRFTN